MSSKFPGLAVLAVSLCAFAACTSDSGGGVIIRQNLAPPGDGTCALSPALDAPFIARGTIAMSSPLPYILTPLLQSRITSLMGQESARTVSMRGARVSLTIEGASVDDTAMDLDTTGFPVGAAKFTSLFSAPVAPNGGLTVGEFDIVPTSFLAAVAAKTGTAGRVHVQAVAQITVYGDLGGGEIESEPFFYPVTICNDCILNVVAACPLPTAAMVNTGNACQPYQDGVIDCCSNPDGTLVCPATVATTLQ